MTRPQRVAYIARMTRASRRGFTAAPVLLYGLFGLFLVATGYLIASSLTRRAVPTYVLTAASAQRVQRDGGMIDTLTIDASDADRWRYVSLSRRAVLAPGDSAGWELAVQRYQIRASGAVVDAGSVAFDSARASAALRTVRPPVSAASAASFGHWYRYSWLTHLLSPSGNVYVVHAGGARPFVVQILSYYCPGPTAGCLTVRYAQVAPQTAVGSHEAAAKLPPH